MEWLAENWVVVLLVGGMALMHLFGHGHGHGHGGRGRGPAAPDKADGTGNDGAESAGPSDEPPGPADPPGRS